jgi:DNA repair exonuclease SbcCD ATPase subunit
MYIRRVEITNFQLHGHLVLDFGAGLNAIIGESDKGKTAVLRAIRWVLFNRPDGQAYRKHGTRETAVTLTLDNGLRVTRTRSKTVNRYALERPGEAPVVFDNFGKDVPPEVLQATGVRPAEFRREGFSVELSFGGQFAPPFLLTDSGLVRAQVLGYLSKTSILDAATKALNADIRELGREISSDEKERDKLGEEAHRYDDIEAQAKRIEEIEQGLAGLEQLEKQAGAGAMLMRRIAEIENGRAQQQAKLDRLQDLPNLGALEMLADSVAHGEKLAAHIGRVQQELDGARAQLARVEAVGDISLGELGTLGERYEQGADLNRRAQAWKVAYLAECEKAEAVDTELRQATDELVAMLREMGACPTCFSELDDVALANVQAQLQEGV